MYTIPSMIIDEVFKTIILCGSPEPQTNFTVAYCIIEYLIKSREIAHRDPGPGIICY